jgi:glycosyltransferase involved in cell wall biosynthesis
VLEALATGTDVVISDAPALVEVAGPHGQVFPVGDVEALAELLRELADDVTADQSNHVDRARGQQVRADRRSYASTWTWARCAEATIAAYRSAIG